jgi:hypothetical protein
MEKAIKSFDFEDALAVFEKVNRKMHILQS